jgi:hypothetical protein
MVTIAILNCVFLAGVVSEKARFEALLISETKIQFFKDCVSDNSQDLDKFNQ